MDPDNSTPVQRAKNTDQRREQLAIYIGEQGSVSVSDLAPHFGVSLETIRRDLRVLEERRRIIRSYGRVKVAESGSFETDRAFRARNLTAEKSRIAAAASEFLYGANTIFLDEGFLPLLIGRTLPVDRDLTLVTTSLPAAIELSERPRTTVISVGGRVRTSTLGVVDRWAVSMLNSMEPDLAFIGANGITDQGWLTTPDPTVADTKSAAIAASQRSIFVGSHEKFGRSTFTRFAHVRDFECLLTGHELRTVTASKLEQLGAKVERR